MLDEVSPLQTILSEDVITSKENLFSLLLASLIFFQSLMVAKTV